jgi:hypothetical protein
LRRYIAVVVAKRGELEAQFKMQMTNAIDASRDLPADMRAAYRAANPVARRLERADFEKLAAQARGAA